MKQLTEDYVSFEIAVLLKEKGFDELSTIFYDEDGTKLIECYDYEPLRNSEVSAYAKITQSLALKWLREVHNWYIDIRFNRYYQYYIPIVYSMSGTLESIASLEERPKQYEQAVEAALLYILKKLDLI